VIAKRINSKVLLGVGGLLLLLGVACSLMDVPSPHHAIQRWTLGLGLVLLVMGTTIFLNFLRTHPVRQPEVNDEQV